MRSAVLPFGDGAFLVETGDLEAARTLARAVHRAQRAGTVPAGGAATDVVVGFDSVVVRVDPGTADQTEAWLADLVSHPGSAPHPESPPAAGSRSYPEAPPAAGSRPHPESPPAAGSRPAAAVDIPVTFDGPDLDTVAAAIGASPTAVVDLLTGAPFEVALLGFAPGFPYLVGLPPELAAVARRQSPRPSVPAGSVAIGGGFAAVYPQASPGGWMVLGRTSTRLFDPDRPPFALVQPGDQVQFSVARPETGARGRDGRQGPAPPGAGRPPLAGGGERVIEVVDPGQLTLVEDAGRCGMASLGIPVAGAADPEAMQLANRLVGNADDAACLEVTARGPTLRARHPAHLAVVGATGAAVDVHIDGHAASPDVVVPVGAGQIVSIGRVRVGLRAYVAVAGGIETPFVVGSRSTDLLSGLGPGPLVAGDLLDIGVPGHPHGLLSRSAPDPGDGPLTVRVVLGPHRFPPTAVDALCAPEWSVAPDSNRIGLRLGGGHPVAGAGRPEVTSTGMVTGAVQVPPDGGPIVLMADHATLGGYPVIACVISADLARIGQLRPGDRLRFSPVSPAHARREYRRRARVLSGSVSGWFPTAAAT